MKASLTITICVLAASSHAMASDRTARQTDWSGGASVTGPVEDWGERFESSDTVSWRSPAGQLALSSEPLAACPRNTLAVDTHGAIKIFASDIDQDGDTDILGLSYWGDRVDLFLNDGSRPPQWTRQLIDGSSARPVAVSVADVDGDGARDILVGSDIGARIGWWRNDGAHPPGWTPHVIDDAVPGAHDLTGRDLDLDGDTDIIAVSYENDQVAWWENDGGDPITWTKHMIDDDYDYPTKVDVADLDGDGDRDVVSSGWLAEEIAWWRNDGGDPPRWTRHVIADGFTGSHWAQAADVDGDGRTDVLGAAMDLGTVAWWRNDGGDPLRWQRHTVTDQLPGAVSVHAEDLDGDGDLDVSASGWAASGGVRWWENRNGIGTAWDEHRVDASFGESSSVTVGDVDGSGTLDLLASSWSLDALAWWPISEARPQGTLTSSILAVGPINRWTACGWTGRVPFGGEVSLSARVGDDPSALGTWVPQPDDEQCALPTSGDGYLQYRIHLGRSGDGASPVVEDVGFSWSSEQAIQLRRPSGRVSP
jgi:hypothetical protein